MTGKIAVTGLPKTNKTLFAVALSNMTGIPYIRNRTMYEWYRMYDLFYNKNIEWKDFFLIAVSSYIERTEIESYYEQFISDGASFSELMWLKMNFSKRAENGQQHERNKIEENFERICASYAAQQYDFIAHATHSMNDASSDELYIQLFEKYNITYRIYNAEFLEKALLNITNEMSLSVKKSAEYAIYQAKTMTFQKKPY